MGGILFFNEMYVQIGLFTNMENKVVFPRWHASGRLKLKFCELCAQMNYRVGNCQTPGGFIPSYEHKVKQLLFLFYCINWKALGT